MPSSSTSLLERLTLWQTGLHAVAAAWMFGGRIWWATTPLQLWGAVAAGLTLVGFWHRRQRGAPLLRPLLWLSPALGLALLVLGSSFNPSFEVITFYDQQVYRPLNPQPVWFSAAVPHLARSELAVMLGLYLAGFNLVLNVGRRSALRRLMLVLAGNAVLLAVFGTVQKLSGSDAIFGVQPSPNPTFFASFIYHNHWGPYAVLSMALWFGLIEPLARQDRGRGFWHSPAVLALVALQLLAIAVPLSTSRSSTLMMLVLVAGGAAFLLRRFAREADSGASPGARRRLWLGTALALVGGLAAVGYYAAPILKVRFAKTAEQLSAMRATGGIGDRATLYGDTWRMALDRPGTGWGLESFEMVYQRYTSIQPRSDRLPIYYDQAHSDWLQALAELGFIGTSLLILMGAIPLVSVRRRWIRDPLATLPLAGCLLVAAYAWVEFPFANPAVTITFWICLFAGVRLLQLGPAESPSPVSSA